MPPSAKARPRPSHSPSPWIKDAKLETIDNAGHAVFIDQPQRFRSLLADFVQRHGSEKIKPAHAKSAADATDGCYAI
jgi:hypothetical protein